MSEKERFVVGSNEIGEIIVTDVETGKVYHYGSMSNFLGLIRLLNEQQSIIDEQKIAIDEMITDYKNLEKENEWLRKELKGLNKKYIAFSEATDKRLREMMR